MHRLPACRQGRQVLVSGPAWWAALHRQVTHAGLPCRLQDIVRPPLWACPRRMQWPLCSIIRTMALFREGGTMASKSAG